MENAREKEEKIRLDEEFHLYRARITRNPLYETILAVVQAMLRGVRLNEDYYVNDYANSIQDHWVLLGALEAGQESEASHIAEKHSDRRKRRLLGQE